ncbi:exonuclease domain-containing protein [Daejeonella oryzae]|uniref:exonuclease domain-containing protein n=1 Tax=Daejeonella oryzae TaxID=1122943 RepID=UPI000428B3A1|nr:exonuclease domain-containing protein [Daejeonella oryzae]
MNQDRIYAIVDIETTGGHASANGITEIAILIHNGYEVMERFETLVNPEMNIPIYIRALTGISNEMVAEAPSFKDVASRIFSLLQNKIFVAHNVNFDYSFLKYHLGNCGFDLQCKKLCTVRLGRKIMPGLPSYSLGRFCNHLGIENHGRHRAGGDAEATAILFSMLLQNDAEDNINNSLKAGSKDKSLPPNLSLDMIEKLPGTPGVYYFHNQKSKVIYVGKAKNLRKRVVSHFANNNPGRQKQEFLKNIYSITFNECGTELMAFILESIEIKKHWPEYNRSQKRFEHAYGLYAFEDQNGYLRLAVDKRLKFSSPLYTFNYVLEGYELIKVLIREFDLCPKLCFIQRNTNPCTGMENKSCLGACQGEENHIEYNQRVTNAIHRLKAALPTFAIVDEGRVEGEKSCILMENGIFYGMGYLDRQVSTDDISVLKDQITSYPANDYIRNLIQTYAGKFPEKKLMFTI